MSSVDKGYNIIRDNIQRAMSSVDKGITLLEIYIQRAMSSGDKGITLEITFSGQCHQWTKV